MAILVGWSILHTMIEDENFWKVNDLRNQDTTFVPDPYKHDIQCVPVVQEDGNFVTWSINPVTKEAQRLDKKLEPFFELSKSVDLEIWRIKDESIPFWFRGFMLDPSIQAEMKRELKSFMALVAANNGNWEEYERMFEGRI